MRVIGYINTFDELADTDRRLGRKVANHGLVRALLEHSRAEQLHFFLPFYGAVKPFERVYGPWLNTRVNQERVRLLPALKLPLALHQSPYTAIHAAELDRYFPEMCHLRNRWAKDPFPITCTTHTLSYWSTQVRNLYKVLPGARAYDSIFATSRAAQEYLARSLGEETARLQELGLGASYAGRIDRVPLGVNLAEFSGLERGQALAALGLPPGPFTVLCLGRITPSDKYDLRPILGVLALLNQEREVRLLLAGAGKGKALQELKDTAAGLGLAERMHLFPDFDTSLKPSLFAAADVFLSPADNLQETFGLSILEAMASGLPVVASDFSGYRDLVVHGETGFLVPTLGPADYGLLDAVWPVLAEHIAALQVAQRTALDLKALAGYLATLRDQPELRRNLGRAGQERVARHYDWGVVIRRMEELWDELASQAAAAPPAARPEADVCGAGLGQVFGHFVSRAIAENDTIKPGPLAGEFNAGRWAREPYADLSDLLPPQGLEMILAGLEELGGSARLSRLEQHLGRSLPPQMCEHLVLHGLKYGVLALA